MRIILENGKEFKFESAEETAIASSMGVIAAILGGRIEDAVMLTAMVDLRYPNALRNVATTFGQELTLELAAREGYTEQDLIASGTARRAQRKTGMDVFKE